jgi:hypothetical protein
MPKYLIWIAGLRGPEPQLCSEVPVNGSGKAKDTLAIHAIADTDQRGLKQLAEAYPAPSPIISHE